LTNPPLYDKISAKIRKQNDYSERRILMYERGSMDAMSTLWEVASAKNTI
jgi:hypothetical protein